MIILFKIIPFVLDVKNFTFSLIILHFQLLSARVTVICIKIRIIAFFSVPRNPLSATDIIEPINKLSLLPKPRREYDH